MFLLHNYKQVVDFFDFEARGKKIAGGGVAGLKGIAYFRGFNEGVL